jgi:hypothetical protein
MTKSAKGSEKITRPSSAEDLKKAIDRPIGQPEPAREEQPIGWVFDPDGDLSPVDGSSGPGGQPVDTDQLGPLSGKLPEEGREAGATSAPDDAASRYVGVSGRSDAGSEADQSLHPQTAEPVHIGSGGLITPSEGPRPALPEQHESAPAAGHAAGGGGGGGGSASDGATKGASVVDVGSVPEGSGATQTHGVGNTGTVDHGDGQGAASGSDQDRSAERRHRHRYR